MFSRLTVIFEQAVKKAEEGLHERKAAVEQREAKMSEADARMKERESELQRKTKELEGKIAKIEKLRSVLPGPRSPQTWPDPEHYSPRVRCYQDMLRPKTSCTQLLTVQASYFSCAESQVFPNQV